MQARGRVDVDLPHPPQRLHSGERITMPNAVTEFRVRRGDLRRTETAQTFPELEPGQVRLRIDRFALTANNITYGLLGEAMNYWNFYPAPDGWGIIPAWGFATVSESQVLGLASGDRFFGYWPMASHAVLTPGPLRPDGFTDVSPHRAAFAVFYNNYARAEGLCVPADEPRYALFRPLFMTSFLIDDYIADAAGGAKAVVLSSASSKTAIGVAQLLAERGGMTVIGLTSPANRAFVEAIGVYDKTVVYDDVATLDADVRSIYVDFSGNAATCAEVHRHFGDALAASLIVGVTDWEAPRGEAPELPGPRPELFFVPTIAAQRIAEWGATKFNAQLSDAWDSFLDSTAHWLHIVEDEGVVALEHRYRDLLEGRARPDVGISLRIG
jgi:hypothetical protein